MRAAIPYAQSTPTGTSTSSCKRMITGRPSRKFGPCEEGERGEQKRPEVADERLRDAAVCELPGRGVEPRLVAALVEEPAVALHHQREDGEHDPLRHDERREDDPGLREPARACRSRSAACIGSGRCSRYHATVRSIPSRSGVFASNPNSSFARDVSSLRRGWPFGFVVSQTISPVEARQLRDQLGEVADRDLLARAEVDGLGAVVALARRARRLPPQSST